MNEEVIKNKILKERDIHKKYELLYDYLYNYLVESWQDNNHCDFKDNKCIANRKGVSVHEDNGCCWRRGIGLCTYLTEDKKICSCESISCKFFTCSYLRRKGINFKPKKIPLVNDFLNRKQKSIIVRKLFLPKNEVIDLLIKHDKVM